MTTAPVPSSVNGAGAPVTEQQWRAHRAEALAAGLPPALTEGKGLPDVLLAYQAQAVATVDANDVTVIEKSRRIGLTWGLGACAVLRASSRRSIGGMDVMYLGYNLDMAREFIDACAMWARAFSLAAGAVDEFLFPDEDHPDKAIQAFRIRFASGFEIVALTSRPRSLRGRQGLLIADEAAFHDELAELLKAAMAFLIWGGKVVVVSTHDGSDNPFNELVEDCRNGRKPFALIRITFDDAVRDGLYRRICLVTGKTWSAAAEAEWVGKIRAQYGEDAGEELDVVPKAGGGAWLSRALIVARQRADIPVLRWQPPDGFVMLPDEIRKADCGDWLEAAVAPVLVALPSDQRKAVGVDFGRTLDLTVIWILCVTAGLAKETRLVIELRDVPFTEQEQVVTYVLRRLARLYGAAFDARGNGQFLAERALQKFGSSVVEAVMLTEAWYREQMPPLKADFEDGKVTVPEDDDIQQDLRAVRMVRGVPRVPDSRTEDSGGKRHGDAAVAVALARYAADSDGIEYSGYRAASIRRDIGIGGSAAAGRDERRSSLRKPEPHSIGGALARDNTW